MQYEIENPLSVAAQKNQLISGALQRESDAGIEIKKSPRIGEGIIQIFLFLAGLVSILTTIGIVVSLLGQALTFFQMEAWLPARAFNVDTRISSIPLLNEIDADATEIILADSAGNLPDGIQRIPYTEGLYLRINDEIMRVEGVTRRSLRVDRGLEGTTASNHNAGVPIEPLMSTPIRLSAEQSADDNLIEITTLGEAPFQVDQVIRIYNEEMRVTGIAPDGSSITVERGYDGTEAVTHPANEPLRVASRPTLIEFVTGGVWQPEIGNFGVLPLITATLVTTVVALIVSLPLGLGAAIFLSEYASPRTRGILKPILEILAGIPTIVYGFFALTFMTPLLRALIGSNVVELQNTASAGLVMGIMIIPTISSISEDALGAVPRALREASYGLGATKLETVVRVVIPAALSGIIAAFILGMARAVGETMIVRIAAGAGPNLTLNPFSAAETMTGHIARISSGDIAFGTIQYNSVFAIGLALFLITLALNLISGYVSRRFREVYQ